MKIFHENGLEAAVRLSSRHALRAITPLKFFVWGLLKDLAYREKSRTVPDLSVSISTVIKELNAQFCKRVCRSVPDRLWLCIDHDGGHFENFK